MNDDTLFSRFVTGSIVAGFLFILGISALISSATIIDAGEQGVVLRYGKIRGETLDSGFHWVAPFVDKVRKFSIREEKIEAGATAASRDLQAVNANVAINLRLDAENVNNLYQEIGIDWKERVVDPAVQETVKAVSAQFTAEELITRRPEVASKITESLVKRLEGKYINILSVAITNFNFSNEFNAAIEAKQVAQQQVAKSQQDLERVKVEAEQKVAQARAEAESQRLQSQTITAEVLQLRFIEKWNGVLPQYHSGGNPFNLFIQPK